MNWHIEIVELAVQQVIQVMRKNPVTESLSDAQWSFFEAMIRRNLVAGAFVIERAMPKETTIQEKQQGLSETIHERMASDVASRFGDIAEMLAVKAIFQSDAEAIINIDHRKALCQFMEQHHNSQWMV